MSDKSRPTIGRYQVESQIGTGGFGRVYKAFDPSVGRPVAIKVLTALDSPDLLARFQTEARTTGSLHHPNIVTILDFGEDEGAPYLVMEYLEGQDMQQLSASGQALSLLDKLHVMMQVAEGLQYAHAQGVIHRDVKPANIRVLPGLNVKVMDFGIARLERSSEERRTLTGDVIGTIRYMSPEQFQGRDADVLSDIFAYGVVFYEFLSGQHPFQASDPAGLMYKVISEQPAPLSQVAPGCPHELEQIVLRAMAKDRDARYQSLEELRLDLRSVGQDLQRQKVAELLIEARSRLDADRADLALAYVDRALDLDPANRDVRELRRLAQDSLGATRMASHTESALREAQVQIERGEFEAAHDRLTLALQSFPGDSAISRLLEEVEKTRSEPARASHREAVLKAAQAQIERGQLEDAHAHLTLASQSYPDDLVISRLLKFVEKARSERQRKNDTREIPVNSPVSPSDATVFVRITDLSPPGAKSQDEETPPDEFTRILHRSATAEPLKASLTIRACPDSFLEGQTIPIQRTPFTIGRNQPCELAISDSALSRKHASISFVGSGYSISDMGSRNGIYVNGRRVQAGRAEPLSLNSEIQLSNATRLRFRCEVSELPDFTGQKLADRYTLENCLRAGRKSAFYEASDSRPLRKVAVKLLSPTLASYPGYLEQFEREAQTAAELSHPNVCKIYEYGRASLDFPGEGLKSVHYLCMQMLDGGSLASRLDAPEHTAPLAVADWLEVVASALADAHRNGVIHAGLKPTSIVFSAAGVPYVTDFAIAIRPKDAEHGRPVLGAPEYLAPEQWEGLPPGPPSDQYSLACLVYRVLTGAVPFENQLEPQTRSRNFEHGPMPADVRAMREGRPPIPPPISGVLAKALSVEPGARFPSITEFALAFRRSLGERAISKRQLRVFVSYRREADAGWAALFANQLSAHHGLDVFVDRHRVDSARQVPEKIEAAIRDCDFFVCLLARTTLESAWVREEIRIADAANKPMIPVVQEGFRRPALSPMPAWLQRFFPRSWFVPEYARRLMDAEEVRLFADYDDGAIEKLARMILSTARKRGIE
jgi:serine/threonine-protein kinase